MTPEIEIGEDGLSTLLAGHRVPRETWERLEQLADLIRHWQKAKNLVSTTDLDHLWQRHILDSAQLALLFPEAERWLDLGSGGGLPGLVTAIMLGNKPGALVTLVESNQRKCAFLRTAIRETGAPAEVRCERIDSVTQHFPAPLDAVSARALASLEILCGMVAPLVQKGTRAVFHKGRNFEEELQNASKSWVIDLIRYPNMVVRDGVIVEILAIASRKD